MDTTTDIDLEQLYLLGNEVEKHCEHSEHRTDSNYHGGQLGLTYVRVLGCGEDRVMLFCNEFLGHAMTGNAYCILCDIPLREHYIVIGPAL